MSASAVLPPEVVTRALRGVEHNRAGAIAAVWRLVYPWVVERAGVLLRCEPCRRELGEAADLAHEAFLKLKPPHLAACRDRHHLLRLATRAMRQALVDRARARRARRRPLSLHDLPDEVPPAARALDAERAMDVAEALDALRIANAEMAEVATLHVIGGLRFVEIGDVMQRSASWARAVWARARAWLEVNLER